MFRKYRLLALAAAALLLFVVGCATTNEESDLPWNMTQPWESSPGIPGLNNSY